MTALVINQLRQLLPFTLLWAALSGFAYLVELFSNRVDEQDFLDWCGTACSSGSNLDQLLILLVLCMLAAYRLFPREFDDGTIDFVRSLPVSRIQIFLSKVLATWLLICALLTTETLITGALLLFNTQSISGQTYPLVMLMLLFRSCLFSLVVVAHGIFISWFRVTGLVLYCAYLIALYWFEERTGTSGIFNLFRFFNSEYYGQQILFDWPAITAQLVLAALFLTISYVLWSRTETQPRTQRSGILARYGPAALAVGGFLLTSVILIGTISNDTRSGKSQNIVHHATEHYRFSYNRNDQARMSELMQFADSDYQALATLLNMESTPFVQARMTLQSNHAFGYASHREIRMKIGDDKPVNPLYRRILSHETAHVFQSVESNRALADHRNSVGFFLEGMAQYTSFAIVPDERRRQTNWTLSSVAWERQDITFDQLAFRGVFDATFDAELIYGLGDLWVDAMVQHCGESSLGDFLRSTAAVNSPRDLQGPPYWRYQLSAINCDLDQINHLWRQRMQQIVDTRTDGGFPTFSDVATRIANDRLQLTITLTPDPAGALPQRYLLRMANETSIANRPHRIVRGQIIERGPETTVQFDLPLSSITGQRFRYQLGFVPYPDSRHYFEKWRNGTLPNTRQ